MSLQQKNKIGLSLVTFVSAGIILAGCGGGASVGASTVNTNKFSMSSRAMTADDIAPHAITTQDYKGTMVSYDAGSHTVGVSSIAFTVENNGTEIFFKTFSIDKLSTVADSNVAGAPVPDIATNKVCFSNGAHGASNYIQISDGANRLVKFSAPIHDGLCTSGNVSDITEAGILYSNDFSTFVGGDNGTFFFMAQKATATPTYSLADVTGNYPLLWFGVNTGTGAISTNVTQMSPKVSVGNGTWSGISSGAIALPEPSVGAYLYSDTAATGSGVAGAFIMSPDKLFLLGVDLTEGYPLYFAASK